MDEKIKEYDTAEQGQDLRSEDKASRLKRALDVIVRELNITYGSFTVFIHQGKWNSRIKIQNDFFEEVNQK